MKPQAAVIPAATYYVGCGIMLVLPEALKQNIVFVIEQAGLVSDSVSRGPIGTELSLQIDLVTSEIALIALITADSLEGIKNETTSMAYYEVSRLLKEIAFLCLDVQETDDAREIKAFIRNIHCMAEAVADYTGIPKYESPAETSLTVAAVTESALSFTALQLRPDSEDNIEKLRAEIRALRELLASLVFERDNLINVVLRDIEATYMRELGGLEAEVYQAECEVRILKARLEKIQACLNREETIQEEKIDEDIRKQYEEYRKIYEEFIRQIFEANTYHQQRAKQKARREKTDEGRDDQNPSNQVSMDNQSREEQASETEEQELKRLYRKIVKAMHPDLHPDQDEATKDLFKRAILAYKDFDIKTLREIAAMLDGEISDKTENLLEALLKERSRLLALIKGIRTEIRSIKSRYPYTQKAILEDPVRLDLEKGRLKIRIEHAKQAAGIYRERIAEVMKKNGRTDFANE